MIWCLMRQQEWVRPRDSSWEGLRQRQRKRGGGEDRLWGLCHSRFQQSHQDSPKLPESSGRSGEPLLCVPPSDRLYFNWSGNFRHLACKPWLRGTVLGDPAISSWNYLSIKYLCVCVCMCVCVCVCAWSIWSSIFKPIDVWFMCLKTFLKKNISSSYELWVTKAKCPYLHKLHCTFVLLSWALQSLENKQGIMVQNGSWQLSWWRICLHSSILGLPWWLRQ